MTLLQILDRVGERCIMQEHGLTNTTKQQEISVTAQQIEKDILELIGDNDIVEFGDPLLSPTHADLKARARDELRQELRLKLKEYIGGAE